MDGIKPINAKVNIIWDLEALKNRYGVGYTCVNAEDLKELGKLMGFEVVEA